MRLYLLLAPVLLTGCLLFDVRDDGTTPAEDIGDGIKQAAPLLPFPFNYVATVGGGLLAAAGTAAARNVRNKLVTLAVVTDALESAPPEIKKNIHKQTRQFGVSAVLEEMVADKATARKENGHAN